MTTPGPTVYLDHAATTPILPVALDAMTAQLAAVGNANSLHASGRSARRVVEEARETIARSLGCRPGDVVFTSGGTEADNLALKGIFWARRGEDPRRVRILSTAVEHHAVLDPLVWLASDDGAEVELLPVDERGRLDVGALRASIERDPASVALVSVMWANNEVGTLQPLDEVVALAAEHGIPVHTDAVQAVGAVPVDFEASGVDALSFTGHKVGGPYGVGALVVRRDLKVSALVHGGGQERDIRSGTLDPPAIAGLAAAIEASVKAQPEHAERVAALRDDLVRRVVEVGARRPPARGRARSSPRRRGRRPAAGQRPHRLPGLRGRLAAHAARRPWHRVLHRLGLQRRRPAAVPRAARHGLRRRPGPPLAALLARPHLHGRRHRRPRRGDRAGRGARPRGPATVRPR